MGEPDRAIAALQKLLSIPHYGYSTRRSLPLCSGSIRCSIRFETIRVQTVSGGGAAFKAVRGGHGSGKTFFSRWLTERAKRAGFATTEVQISEQKRPCTSWRPSIGASLRTSPPRRLSRAPSETSLTVGSNPRPRRQGWSRTISRRRRNARPPPTSTVRRLERGAGLRRCAAAVPAGADGE